MGNTFDTSAATGPGTGTDLLAIREEFVKTAMRFDLVIDTVAFADDGANYFINRGQRWLDENAFPHKQSRRHMISLALDEYKLNIKQLLAVERVTIIDPSDGRSDITKNRYTPEEFRIRNPEQPSEWTAGLPSEWALNIIGLSPEQMTKTSADFTTDGVIDFDDIHFAGDATGIDWLFNGIVLFPKTDAVRTVEIVGRFRSIDMTLDTDKTFWTVNYPELSVLAATYMVERRMGNAARARFWREQMQSDIHGMEIAEVESELGGREMHMENIYES